MGLVSAVHEDYLRTEGGSYLCVVEGVAEWYSADLSQKTLRGMRHNAERCMANGVPVFGYAVGEDGRYVVDDAQAAVVREVFEETGRTLEIDRLGFVAEDYFICDAPAHLDKLVYEIGFYFYMKTPADFEPVCGSFTEDGAEEFLVWADPEERRKLYPVFFNDELRHPEQGVKHFVTDQRE